MISNRLNRLLSFSKWVLQRCFKGVIYRNNTFQTNAKEAIDWTTRSLGNLESLLPVFEVKSYNHGVKFMNMYLSPILVKKCSINSDQECTPFVSIKVDDIQLFTLFNRSISTFFLNDGEVLIIWITVLVLLRLQNCSTLFCHWLIFTVLICKRSICEASFFILELKSFCFSVEAFLYG